MSKLTKDWKIVKFSDVVFLRHGHQFRKYDFVEKGIPVIKITQCTKDGSLDLSKCDFIDYSRKDEFKEDVIVKGDILMALTGGTLGKVTEVNKDYGFIVQNYRVGNFIPKKDIDRSFIKLILLSDIFQDLIREKVNQGAQPNIGKENIDNLQIPLPPIPVQKQIVAKLDALFERIDKSIALLEENIKHTQDLMASALDEEFGKIKDNDLKIGDVIVEIQTGKTPPTAQQKYYENASIDWFSPSDFNDDTKELINSKNKVAELAIDEGKAKMYPANSVLLVAIGATIGKVGLLKYSASSNQQITSLTFNDDIIPDYAYYWFRKLKKHIVNISPNATLPIINQKGIKDLPFRYPSIEKQKKLIQKLDVLTINTKKIIVEQTQKLNYLKYLKSSLLDMAFKGELVK